MIELFKILTVIFGLDGPVPLDTPVSQCDTAVWKSEPRRLPASKYGAEITVRCTVQPQLGGDFDKLEAFALDEMKRRGTFVSGPTAESFEGMPSLYSDYVLRHSGKDFTIEAREDVHIASDKRTRMLGVLNSTQIRGTGNGEHLKKVDIRIEVIRTAEPGKDLAFYTVSGEVTKPWYIPESMLLAEAKKRGPEEFARFAGRFSEELSRNY